MQPKQSILDCIGHTPIVRLARLSEGLPCTLLAKLDHLNPGGSVKDRIGIAMIRDAERRGLLKPGGTITEGTAGNTGLGLAIAANVLGYKCVFCLPDKMSKEKIDLPTLRHSLEALNLGEVALQDFGGGQSVLIRVQRQPGGEQEQTVALNQIKDSVTKAVPGATLERTEVVGPTVSSELARSGFLAVGLAMVAILLYIWFRFEWHFAVARSRSCCSTSPRRSASSRSPASTST